VTAPSRERVCQSAAHPHEPAAAAVVGTFQDPRVDDGQVLRDVTYCQTCAERLADAGAFTADPGFRRGVA
jgi:hypothetical protein